LKEKKKKPKVKQGVIYQYCLQSWACWILINRVGIR